MWVKVLTRKKIVNRISQVFYVNSPSHVFQQIRFFYINQPGQSIGIRTGPRTAMPGTDIGGCFSFCHGEIPGNGGKICQGDCLGARCESQDE